MIDMILPLAIISGLITFIATALAMPLVLRWLESKHYHDIPVARSAHSRPVLRGGGLAVIPIALTAIAAVFAITQEFSGWPILIAATAALTFLSWQDDIRPLSPAVRFALHIIAVGAAVLIFPYDLLLFQGLLPLWADRMVTFWALLWYVNLYNFMDGLDGITGMQTASLGLGVPALMLFLGIGGIALPTYGFILAGAALAFLIWNWHPAKVFIGDVGSVPLGLLTGWLLIYMAMLGPFWPACILPLYYCFDATITLARRFAKGEKIWEPHKTHFFRLASEKLGHAKVVLMVLGLNVFLFICAVFATSEILFVKYAAILASGFATLGLLSYFYSLRPR